MKIEITRTYLQMTSPEQHRRAPLSDPRAGVACVRNCPASFYRYLYAEVGRSYHWVDKLNYDG